MQCCAKVLSLSYAGSVIGIVVTVIMKRSDVAAQ